VEPCYQSHVHLHMWCLIVSVCMIPHHFHDDTSHLDYFTCLILSQLLITPTDNKLIFHLNFVQFLSLTSCYVITQNVLHHRYKSQPVYMILSRFYLPPILSTDSYPQKFIIWWMFHQVPVQQCMLCGAELCLRTTLCDIVCLSH